jgi:DNA-binding GntR family transcriptional regulator
MKHATTADSVAAALRNALHQGRWSAGAALRQEELAAEFGVSRIPVREALRHAIPRHTPRTLRQLHALQAELDAEDDPNLWLATDAAFHEVLYAPSDRTKTLEMIAVLRASVTRLYRAHLTPHTRRRGWRDEHHALLKAVAGGHVERALAALARHLRETEAATVAAVASAADASPVNR